MSSYLQVYFFPKKNLQSQYHSMHTVQSHDRATILIFFLLIMLLSAVDLLAPKLRDSSRHPPTNSLPRPFTEHPVPALSASVDRVVEFPDDTEDAGCVMIGWRAHEFSNFAHSLALNILHAYLSESELSVLHSHFVEGGESAEEAHILNSQLPSKCVLAKAKVTNHIRIECRLVGALVSTLLPTV